MTQYKYDIFISYSRKDLDEVNKLIEVLCLNIPDLTYWYDIKGIGTGDEFQEKIINAINCSSYVLFALSNNSIKSKWTKKEIMYAKNRGKKIVPVLLEGATLNDWFLFEFGIIDCIDSTSPAQLNKLSQDLSTWTKKEISRKSTVLPVATITEPQQYSTKLVLPWSTPVSMQDKYNIFVGCSVGLPGIVFAYIMKESIGRGKTFLDLNRDGILLIILFIFLSSLSLSYIAKSIKSTRTSVWKYTKWGVLSLSILNSLLLFIWNQSLTMSYFVLSICLSVISAYMFSIKWP